MSAQDDTMKLVAELLDKTSGPLKDIQKSLRETSAIAKKLHSEGSAGAKAHARSYRELGEAVGKAKEMVSGVLSPALAALGITGFAAGEAVGKLVESLKNAAENYHKLNDAARQLGGSVDDVKEIVNAYQSMGIAQDKAVASAASLGFHMDRMRRGNVEEREQWFHLGGSLQALWPLLAKTKSNFEALQVVRDFQSKNHIPVDQMKELWGFIGQPEELGRIAGEEWADARAKAIKNRMEHPDNPGLNKNLAKSFDDLRYALQGFDDDMVEAFGGRGAKAIEQLAVLISGIGKDFKDLHDLWIGKPNEESNWLPKGGNWINPKIPEFLKKLKPNVDNSTMLPGYSPMSFTSGGTGDKLAESVKSGMLAAFREWFAATSSSKGDGGGNGYTNANYQTGGGNDNTPIGKAVRNAIHGGGDGDGSDVPAGNGPVSGLGNGKRDVASIAAQEWRAAGMTDDGVAGIMANVRDESNFNPRLRHPDQPHFGGEAHFAHGLYQEGGTEWNHYEAWIKKNYPGADWRDPALQKPVRR
jgi:Phage tail lysozyme